MLNLCWMLGIIICIFIIVFLIRFEYYKNPLYDNYICDVFYNDENNLVIISPGIIDKPHKIFLFEPVLNKYIEMKVIKCPKNNTYVYETKLDKYYSNVKIKIEGKVLNKKVNQYPVFENEIIMSTLVFNEDSYVRQWIIYHKGIGVKRFIIYDNSKSPVVSVKHKSNLKLLLKDFIDNKTVVLIDWPFAKRVKFLANDKLIGQTSQQTHSVYAFKKAKYIGMLDIDEYVNPQMYDKNIDTFFSKLIKDHDININDIGAFRLEQKRFHNSDNIKDDDFNFLKVYNCGSFDENSGKLFVIPKNVKTVDIHDCSGLKTYKINNKFIYYNHYCFLNKTDRCRNKIRVNEANIVGEMLYDDSITKNL